MPIIKSARKRVKTAAKANQRNYKTKRSMREAVKAFTKALSGGNAKTIGEAERAAVSAIDLAAKKAVIHKNKAAREKARLSARAKAAGAKPLKQTAKPAAKKPVAKKSSAKKPAAKKPAKK
ncbi:MAG TPA: 30S ribosomal protein S20 [Candidatus Saccharimonadales bacterium]|nr:30S ribosomal protein S20 [Candidatus Saccharimonadales bacterium]